MGDVASSPSSRWFDRSRADEPHERALRILAGIVAVDTLIWAVRGATLIPTHSFFVTPTVSLFIWAVPLAARALGYLRQRRYFWMISLSLMWAPIPLLGGRPTTTLGYRLVELHIAAVALLLVAGFALERRAPAAGTTESR